MHILSGLNPPQEQAVGTIHGPLLILAGAGSGKTRVITHRIAYMLTQGIPQSAILALTFTNKAAREMAARVRSLLGYKPKHLVVSTFHAFGVRLLRDHIASLGYRPNFSIYDVADQASLIKSIAREQKFHLEPAEPPKLAHLFSDLKTGLKQWDPFAERYRSLYEEYESHMKVYNAVDFNDLILLPLRLLTENDLVRHAVQDRYQYVLVDEFQDTSRIQYELLHAIGEKNKNVCVVGDDDQSIYSWRGANYENIERFERDFPGVVEIKLEQNYRSTSTILGAANRLIANNKNRKGKELWTGIAGGHQIQLAFPENEQEEADFIADTLRTHAVRDRVPYGEIGILVRANHLTRPIEEELLRRNIPYVVTGGTSFFARAEVKDLLAYLRVVANHDDDVSFMRCSNTPRRGIGKRTIEVLSEFARERDISLFSAATMLTNGEPGALGRSALEDLASFLELIATYRSRFLGKGSIADALRDLIGDVDYYTHLFSDNHHNDKVARFKYRNAEILVESIRDFEKDPDNFDPSLFAYLNRISLQGKDEPETDKGKVNLMTMHAAKGLEFELVFVAGVEDAVVPHARAIEENPANIEEERRLFYVAITRAKRRLYLTSCRTRKSMQSVVECEPSRFLDEIPAELIDQASVDELTEPEDAAKIFGSFFEKAASED